MMESPMVQAMSFIKDYPQRHVLSALYRTAYESNSAIAIWRCPHTNKYLILINIQNNLIRGKAGIAQSEPGFLFSPFINPEGNNSYFIPGDIIYDFQTKAVSFGTRIHTEFIDTFISTIKKYLKSDNFTPEYYRVKLQSGGTDKQDFLDLVNRGLFEIEQNSFQKIVVARTKSVRLSRDFNLLDTFLKLSQKHQNAFISLITFPKIGTWIGASPELLIETNKHEIFRTVSLAGTQPFNGSSDPAEASWKQKDIEEQAMVSRFIINQFKKIRLREFEESGPKTVTAGSMIHLKTEFTVDTEKVNLPELGSVMLNLLHPTSAVCGMPKIPSLEFLIKNESFDRLFYSGYLGPVNIHSETRVYVNLRCMQIGADEALLYAGAGITHDSNPHQEWEETKLKCNTMFSVLNGEGCGVEIN